MSIPSTRNDKNNIQLIEFYTFKFYTKNMIELLISHARTRITRTRISSFQGWQNEVIPQTCFASVSVKLNRFLKQSDFFFLFERVCRNLTKLKLKINAINKNSLDE